MIEVRGLTKRYRNRSVVDDLSFRVRPGVVTGFFGPTGSGKTTTARVILGLTQPSRGTATIDGRCYRDIRHPLREIGALIDPGAVNPNRTAVEHLRWLDAGSRLPAGRAEEVLGVVGLASASGRKVGGFSLGCASDSASPPRSSVTRPSWSSTSRSTGWIQKESAGCVRSLRHWPLKAGRSSCPAT